MNVYINYEKYENAMYLYMVTLKLKSKNFTNTKDIEISYHDSHRKDSDEENSNEQISDEEN